MKVIICGAGQVGFGIAERLAAEKNDVSIIDISPELIRSVRDTLDVRGFIGHGAHPDVLVTAGIEEADMLIAVTLFDEVNMIACQVAHSLFDVPTKIARIRSQSYLQSHYMDLFSREHLPIDVIISPEIEVGDRILRRIAFPGAAEVIPFVDGQVVMIAIECLEECPVINTPLKQLTELFPDLSSTVVGVLREEQLFIPHSDDQLVAGDMAYVITPKEQIRRTLGLFGHDEKEAKRIIIAGGGNIGLYVAEALEARQGRTKVKLLEKEKDRAEFVADQLRHTVVLHGDALDQKLLLEADVDHADLIVALTNDDQANILSSVIAKQLGCKANLVLLNSLTYHDFAGTLGIDSHINPRDVTISRVLRHVRKGRIREIYNIEGGAAEILEAEALETSPLVGPSLRELDLPDGMRIGGVFREGRFIQPSGALRIKRKDRVIIFAMAGVVRQVEQLFRVSLEFF